jgi:hypothetical protein
VSRSAGCASAGDRQSVSSRDTKMTIAAELRKSSVVPLPPPAKINIPAAICPWPTWVAVLQVHVDPAGGDQISIHALAAEAAVDSSAGRCRKRRPSLRNVDQHTIAHPTRLGRGQL